VVKGFGIPVLKQFGIMDKLQAAVENKKSIPARQGSLLAVRPLCAFSAPPLAPKGSLRPCQTSSSASPRCSSCPSNLTSSRSSPNCSNRSATRASRCVVHRRKLQAEWSSNLPRTYHRCGTLPPMPRERLWATSLDMASSWCFRASSRLSKTAPRTGAPSRYARFSPFCVP